MPLMTPKPGVEVAAPGLPGKNGCWPIQGPAMPSTSGNHHRKLSTAMGARSVQDVWSFWVEKALSLTWLNRLRMPATDSSIRNPGLWCASQKKFYLSIESGIHADRGRLVFSAISDGLRSSAGVEVSEVSAQAIRQP